MNDVSTKLSDLLEEEKQALMSGDLQRVATLMDEKNQLAEALEKHPQRTDLLRPLQTALHRNHDLFDRALEALRSVAARLGTMQQLRKSLETYDALGQRLSISENSDGKLEKRA